MSKTDRQKSGRNDASQGPDWDADVELVGHVASMTTITTTITSHSTQISARQQYGQNRAQRQLEHQSQHQGRQDRHHREGGHHGHIHTEHETPHTPHTEPDHHHHQGRPHPHRHLSDPYNKHARGQHRTAPAGQENDSVRMGNNTPNQRRWSADIHGENYFTLMTYNLLSKTLCQSHAELYSNCHPKSLNWSKRSKTLLREIKSHDLDIYCFQELDQDDYTDLFEPTLRSWGYTGFYQRRTGDRNDGCALFYRSQKVTAVLIRGVTYNRNQFIGRDNVGVVAILEVTQGQSKKKVCVATTHILFNPRRGMVKIAQLKMLLESAQLLIEEQDEDIPLVLCGDMNAAPKSFVLHFLQSPDVDATMQAEVCMSQMLLYGSAARPSGTYPNGINDFNASFQNIRQDLAGVLGTAYRPLPLQLEQHHMHTPSDVLTQMANMHIPSGAPHQQQHQQQYHYHHHHHRHPQHQQQQHAPSWNRVSQPFQLQSAYAYACHAPIAGRQKKYRQWTTYHTASKQMCDFIMYGHLRSTSTTTITPPPPPQKPSRLKVLATLVLPCRELDSCHGLPIRHFGSDHLSLATKFRFV